MKETGFFCGIITIIVIEPENFFCPPSPTRRSCKLSAISCQLHNSHFSGCQSCTAAIPGPSAFRGSVAPRHSSQQHGMEVAKHRDNTCSSHSRAEDGSKAHWIDPAREGAVSPSWEGMKRGGRVFRTNKYRCVRCHDPPLSLLSSSSLSLP